ncbi:MAG: thiamine-phosphate kinase [bacterium]|nr:thiamine-phosphate kinase [bacterium]
MKSVCELGEFGLIARLARMLPVTPSVLEGIGDDCAILRLYDHVMLLSSDMSVENVHFRRDTLDAEEIGWRVAASSVSDIAAMGGAPMFSLVSLACPRDTPVTFVESVYQGMCNVFAQYGGCIVGGDTVRTDGPIAIDVAIIGEARGSRCLRRKGAQPGDLLAVTGYPGLSAAGLDAIERGVEAPELTQRHRWPRPRVREGQWLCDRPEIHSMLDTSDGLVQDAGHLAKAAELGVDIDPSKVPLLPALANHCEANGLDPMQIALTGGEDYELAFAMSVENHEETLDSLHKEFRTVVTVVGQFTDAWTGVRVGGEPVETGGFDHFSGGAA